MVAGEHVVEFTRDKSTPLETNRGKVRSVVHTEIVERTQQSLVESIPQPGFPGDASVEPLEHRPAIGALRRSGQPEENLRLESLQKAFVARSGCVMKLIHDDHIESFGIDIIYSICQGLDRGKDVTAFIWTLAANEPFPEPRFPEYKLEDLLALEKNLVTMCDEQHGLPMRCLRNSL